MVYYLFREHHVLPSVYFSMGHNEKQIMRAFFEKEIEEKRREQEQYSD